MGSEKLRSIRNYLFRQGRPLDAARWMFHFEDGTASEVLRTLKAYQNMDGGFGHGLEPDNQNPHSTALATWAAVRILREIGIPKLAESMISKMLIYLGDTQRGDGKWKATTAENNDFPHAPWWTHKESDPPTNNPTAELASFILRTDQKGSERYHRAESVIREITSHVSALDYAVDPHELSNLAYMLDDLDAADRLDLVSNAVQDKIAALVNREVNASPARYRNGVYGAVPSSVIFGRQSPYYELNADVCADYADFLEASVTPEGFWDITWAWGNQPVPEDAVRQWRSVLIMENMLFLQHLQSGSGVNG